ncbi:hypothetical protein AF344_17975 [Salmonella enterica subsp. enterica serovar Typhimurium]|nr:hypothetical protein AF344_17975 [Salmonella enterica subsp. enterica serovar Typhimurium]
MARGTLFIVNAKFSATRFIPAGAGNTLYRQCEIFRDAVYPRWRGEHSLSSMRNFPRRGLSPLARGTLFIVNAKFSATRFIPAGAGNTLYRQCEIFRDAVYPRWRGEHTKRI